MKKLMILITIIFTIAMSSYSYAGRISVDSTCNKIMTTAPANITVTKVEYVDYSGFIEYSEQNGQNGTLVLDKLDFVNYNPFPIFVLVDENFATFTGDTGSGLRYKPNSLNVLNDMVGQTFKELFATKISCHLVYPLDPLDPVMRYIPDGFWTQWDIQAKTAGQITTPSRNGEFEGKVTKIDHDLINNISYVTISTIIFTINTSTNIKVNGNTGSLFDIKVGQKAAGRYDTGTFVSWEIFLEG